MTVHTPCRDEREVDCRTSGNLEITLNRNPVEDTMSVRVRHLMTAETASFEVPNEMALDAFHHPFTHRTPNPSSGSVRTWSLRTIWN
jgi:hypothetical protein